MNLQLSLTKKSTQQCLDVLDGQSTRLCDAAETAKADIRELNIYLDESQIICTAMTDAVAILFDLRKEMEALRLQLRILQHVVGNGQAPCSDWKIYKILRGHFNLKFENKFN